MLLRRPILAAIVLTIVLVAVLGAMQLRQSYPVSMGSSGRAAHSDHEPS
jgi:hypothetical protein